MSFLQHHRTVIYPFSFLNQLNENLTQNNETTLNNASIICASYVDAVRMKFTVYLRCSMRSPVRVFHPQKNTLCYEAMVYSKIGFYFDKT